MTYLNDPAPSGIALVKRLFLEGFSKNNPDVLRNILAEDFALYSGGVKRGNDPGQNESRRILIDGMAHNHRSFENWRFELDFMMEDQNHVAVRWTGYGRHVGSFAGEPPTGNNVVLKGNSIYRIKNGKIAEDYVFSNKTEFQQQLGIGTAPDPSKGEALVRRFWEEVINAHNPEAADTLMAKSYKQNAKGIDQGPAGFKAFFHDVLNQSSGMKAEINGILVVEHFVISSTKISFETPPPGWDNVQTIVDVFRTDGNKLLEHWDMQV